MYIKYCPIPFHDLMEIYEFLLSLSPAMATLFDGCVIDGFPLQFYSHYSADFCERYLLYRFHRE